MIVIRRGRFMHFKSNNKLPKQKVVKKEELLHLKMTKPVRQL